MVKITRSLAILVLAALADAGNKDKKPKTGSKYTNDIDWSIVKYDPNTADTVEDAAWNCIVDFNEIEPKWVCNFTNKIAKKYAQMCTPDGNVELMRSLVYPFCALRQKTKPVKRPYLKKSKGPASVYNIDVDVDLDVNMMTRDAVVTVTASDHPIVINIDAGDLAITTTTNGRSTKNPQSLFSSATGNSHISVVPTGSPSFKTLTRTPSQQPTFTMTLTRTATDGGSPLVAITKSPPTVTKFRTVTVTASAEGTVEQLEEHNFEDDGGLDYEEECFEEPCLLEHENDD
jgi:hypothetical protein